MRRIQTTGTSLLVALMAAERAVVPPPACAPAAPQAASAGRDRPDAALPPGRGQPATIPADPAPPPHAA